MSKANVFGEYKTLNFKRLKSKYKFDERDFSKWLALPENLNLLAKAIGNGMELTDAQTEQYVNGIPVDILCKDVGRPQDEEEYVIIENQVRKSDHSHLGQLLSYAAGHGASTCIWVAPKFADYHLEALKWLNKETSRPISFFAVEVTLISIDDSRPVPIFKLVLGNEQSGSDSMNAEVADEIFLEEENSSASSPVPNQLFHKYWTKLMEYLSDNGFKLRKPKPTKKGFQTFFTMKSNLVTVYAMLKTGYRQITIEIYIRDKEMYQKLEKQKETIEKEVGANLIWKDLDNTETTRIVLEKNIDSPRDESTWDEHFAWFKENLEKMSDTFRSRIEEIDAQNDEE